MDLADPRKSEVSNNIISPKIFNNISISGCITVFA
jgi:hypothetical protein